MKNTRSRGSGKRNYSLHHPPAITFEPPPGRGNIEDGIIENMDYQNQDEPMEKNYNHELAKIKIPKFRIGNQLVWPQADRTLVWMRIGNLLMEIMEFHQVYCISSILMRKILKC